MVCSTELGYKTLNTRTSLVIPRQTEPDMVKHALLMIPRPAGTALQLVKIATSIVVAALLLAGCDAIGGKSAQEHYQAAEAYADKGEFKASVIELKNALQKNPDHAEARFLLGNLYLALEDAQTAVKELQRARELGVTEDRVRLPLLRAQLAVGAFQKVLDAMAEMPEAEKNATLLTLAGMAHAGLGDSPAADFAFEKAIALDPNAAEAYIGLARLASQGGQPDAAKRYAEQALAVMPGGNAQAAVLNRRGVDGDNGRDEEVRIGVPPRLGILVRLEAVSPGLLEVYLFLEQHRRFPEQLFDRRCQGLRQGRESRVIGGDVLDPADDLLAGPFLIRLPEYPVPPRHFGQREQFVGPVGIALQLTRIKGIADDDETVAAKALDLTFREPRGGNAMVLSDARFSHSPLQADILPKLCTCGDSCDRDS